MKMLSDSKIEGQSRQCEDQAHQLVHVVIECRHKSKNLWSKSLQSSTDEQHTANPFPVMITGISLCSNSHREFPVMNT